MHHPPSIHTGMTLNLLPDKSQTLLLPSFVNFLQLFHPDSAVFLGSCSLRGPKPMLGNWLAASARGLPRAWCHCWLAVSREGTVPSAGVPCQAELKHQATFSHPWGKVNSRNKTLFNVPLPLCKWCWAASGLPSPWPSTGLWTELQQERMVQSKWNKRALLVF